MYQIHKRPKDDSGDEAALKEEEEPRYELGYWKVHGLAFPARMMLVFAAVPFDNKMYAMAGSADADEKCDEALWVDSKFKLGLDFPSLPYFVDKETGLKITTAKSIYRYIARRLEIGVQDASRLGVADMMLETVGQIMGVESPSFSEPDLESGAFLAMSYGPLGDQPSDEEHEVKKTEYVENMPTVLKSVEAFMAQKEFVTGSEISYADFALYYLCVTHAALDPEFPNRFPNLTAFALRFNELEGMKRWKRTEMRSLPFNNETAKFGAGPMDGVFAQGQACPEFDNEDQAFKYTQQGINNWGGNWPSTRGVICNKTAEITLQYSGFSPESKVNGKVWWWPPNTIDPQKAGPFVHVGSPFSSIGWVKYDALKNNTSIGSIEFKFSVPFVGEKTCSVGDNTSGLTVESERLTESGEYPAKFLWTVSD